MGQENTVWPAQDLRKIAVYAEAVLLSVPMQVVSAKSFGACSSGSVTKLQDEVHKLERVAESMKASKVEADKQLQVRMEQARAWCLQPCAGRRMQLPSKACQQCCAPPARDALASTHACTAGND